MAAAQTYQSEFTGSQMDARFRTVATLAQALTVLEQAIAAKYTKPADGIPSTDMDASVQSALALALTSVQSLADYYTKSEVDSIAAAIAATVNATSGEVVASLPTASASTLGKIYYVGPTSGEYDRYVTSYDGTTYSWLQIGTTDVDMTQYATKAELSQLDQIVNKMDGAFDFPPDNIMDLSQVTARDNSSSNITWSISDGVITMSTSVNSNQHLYLNIPGVESGKSYKLTLVADNLTSTLNLFTGSDYVAMTKDGTKYEATFTAKSSNYLDFMFRNKTINVSDVVLVESEAAVMLKPANVKDLTLDNLSSEAKAEVLEFDNIFAPAVSTPTPSTTSDMYIRNDGVPSSSNGWSYTEPMLLHAGEIIMVRSSYDLDVVAMISETDSEGTIYTPLFIGKNTGETYKFIAPRDMYVALSFRTANHDITKVSSYVLDGLSVTKADPAQYLLDIIGKYTAIGDSMTAGAIFNDDAPDGYDNSHFAFPTIIGRRANAETDTVAKSGATSKQIYNLAAELIDYDDTNFYTIWLGTNDGFTAEAYAEVDPDDGWENYPDTYTGAYCKLIDRILDESPNAIVVLINVNAGGTFGDTGCTLASTKSVIRQVAEDRNLLCIETEDYTRILKPTWHGLDGGNVHWSVFGYENIARIFMDEIGSYLAVHPEIVEKVYATKVSPYNGVNQPLATT